MVSNEIRNLLLRRCQSPRTRTHQFSANRPTHFAPGEVICPVTQEAFTPAGAYEFICKHLASGIEIEQIELDKPAGKRGYVMLAEAHNGTVYIKLQLLSEHVVCRSFHLSNRSAT